MYPQSNTESKTEETVFRLPVNSNSAEIECSQRVSHELNERYDSQFYLDNFFEYEQGSAEPIVRGRMKANIDFWRNIGAPDEIINLLKQDIEFHLYRPRLPLISRTTSLPETTRSLFVKPF